MRIVFGGAEVGSNRTLLESSGVTLMGVSYWNLSKRGLPKTKNWLVSERFDENVLVVVESGGHNAKEAGLSKVELETYAADYQEFIVNNIDRISGFTEFDATVMGLSWIEQQREFWVDSPEKFWPVWHAEYGLETFRELAGRFSNVAIPYESVEATTTLSSQAAMMHRVHGTEFHGLGIAKPDNLRQVRFKTVSTLAWLAPLMRGETIAWDGTRLARYPKKMKEQALPRYRQAAEKAGADLEKYLDGDSKEATKLAIWSFKRLEEAMERPMRSDHSDEPLHTGLMETGVGSSTHSAPEQRKTNGKDLTPRDPNEVQPLPVFGYQMKQVVDTDGDGNDVLKDVPVVNTNFTSLRQCDTCFVAANCPAFKPTNSCAFNLPIEVKTKDQLKALLNAIIEMQGQRVAFMRFSEEMNGGYADPNVSQEIDRLFKLVKNMKELEENREFIRITAERQSSGGVLSAIFGDRAQALRELPNQGLNEEQTNNIIKQSLEDL